MAKSIMTKNARIENAITKSAIPKTLDLESKDSTVQVELSSSTLRQLLKSGLLHGGDCKCLNASAKQVLWQALLATSTENETHTEHYLCA